MNSTICSSIETLLIGDHDAVNELTRDYRKIIKATAIIRDVAARLESTKRR
ncbi:MAG: hypothetical protein Q6373_020305 [Candidatus Sigynarchaeota archaeon]